MRCVAGGIFSFFLTATGCFEDHGPRPTSDFGSASISASAGSTTDASASSDTFTMVGSSSSGNPTPTTEPSNSTPGSAATTEMPDSITSSTSNVATSMMTSVSLASSDESSTGAMLETTSGTTTGEGINPAFGKCGWVDEQWGYNCTMDENLQGNVGSIYMDGCPQEVIDNEGLPCDSVQPELSYLGCCALGQNKVFYCFEENGNYTITHAPC